ncbi:GPO family capsid scaffolding protein [Klebsiella pneumoniae]|uniref:GPO family capsid scaffolding protein n=1 Tax=Klebsiella TaxID=570 RepID=UPI00049F381C|nr:GPO family capsid scaffolding protein [Klebsiella pneumoniae]HBY0412591.1 phage capsid protein [Klebsiella pneumoniae subsp. pneumoniae]EKJ7333666.1 GPO family capsid scaffolding protein [Klebsiella pneumoniae]EKX6493191.1 GPO family capsid scaffolding protein [Klebsiella pneumoniae]EKX6679233.1 GPO family capsid scaffolding protein [Klebsiella pneumoniae]EKY1370275.1 GPO family capsid scaffolding protein [Klebsiella pneumoniae]
MANQATTRKKFKVMTSGTTVDGRNVTRAQLHAMAAAYNPAVYGARVNIEHYLSPFPDSVFSAMGDVVSLSAEDINEGPLAGEAHLFAEIEPAQRMKDMIADGKKIYSSIEMHPNFPLTKGPYLIGLAMTDTPASLGTDKLKFTAEKRAEIMRFSSQDAEVTLFTTSFEAEMIELAAQRSDEGTKWYARVMDILGKGQRTDDQRFSQVHQAVEAVAQAQSDQLDRFSTIEQERQQDKAAIQKLTSDLDALRQQLGNTDANFSQRPPANGGANAQLADY